MSTYHRIWNVAAAVVLLVCAGFQVGCEDTFIDPFDNDERYYTIYGYLDQSRDPRLLYPHEIRVIPVTRFPERITSPLHPQADIDAKVFSWDVDAREDTTYEWEHRLVQLDDGLFGHVFSAVFPVNPGHTYRLEVHRSDGEVAWAETTVPLLSSVVPVPADVRLDQDNRAILQDILLPGPVSPWQIMVSYDVGGRDCTLDRGVTTPLPYGRPGERTSQGWQFTVNISDDIQRLSTQSEEPNVFFCAMGVRVRALAHDWQIPEGEPAELALPTAYTNIQNGYGFWGSVGFLQFEWPASPELLELISDTGR